MRDAIMPMMGMYDGDSVIVVNLIVNFVKLTEIVEGVGCGYDYLWNYRVAAPRRWRVQSLHGIGWQHLLFAEAKDKQKLGRIQCGSLHSAFHGFPYGTRTEFIYF